MRLGARVIVKHHIALLPHAVIEPGETGTVDSIDPDTGEIWIKLDKYHPGLSEWLNSIWLNDYTDEVADAIAYVEVLQAA